MGSSPLTRGKRPVRRDGRTPPGLIPAHAGKTGQGARPPGPRRAHPRSRGENLARTHWGESSPGSSPLTRGKHRADWPRGRSAGLIPAHAGKTLCSWRFRARARAHPRSRGENRHWCDALEGVAGSSPLTRGKHVGDLGVLVGRGLIPAHAGKTRLPVRTVRRVRAHPRSRGENTAYMRDGHPEMGSSPLTRGKRHVRLLVGPWGGLIPAHAGKTGSAAPDSGARRAHPRSRGENGRHRPL